MRALSSAVRSSAALTPGPPACACDGSRSDRPAARLVVLEVLPPRDPAEDHRLGDPPLLGPDGEVDVRDDQADQADARQAVRHVGEAPRRVAKQIRVAGEERRAARATS